MTSLLLGDLNDYIQPGVACIKPPPAPTVSSSEKAAPSSSSAPLMANLNDCLACAGCITSAESVLISEQSHQQVYDVLAENGRLPKEQRKRVVVSVCAASRTALCRRFQMDAEGVWRRLKYFFEDILEVDLLVDTTFGYNFALRAAAEQFASRYDEAMGRGEAMKAMLSSECPGWICYAEKKQAGMLSQICTVRSPQQIMGALLKTYLVKVWSQRRGGEGEGEGERGEDGPALGRADIFHVSIQACYDKKLEASREEFVTADETGPTRDVDCVIATTELLRMIEERAGAPFPSLSEADMVPVSGGDSIFRSWSYDAATGHIRLLRQPGSSAGGYLFYIMRYAAKQFFDLDLPADVTTSPHVSVQQHRNIDFTAYTLRVGTEARLRFASIYGFRNIQTFVQKAKAQRIDYHFVELMACPGACLFGGGQPKMETGRQLQAEHRTEMERLHQLGPVWADEDGNVERIWQWLQADPQHAKLLYTSYRSLQDLDQRRPAINVQW